MLAAGGAGQKQIALGGIKLYSECVRIVQRVFNVRETSGKLVTRGLEIIWLAKYNGLIAPRQ